MITINPVVDLKGASENSEKGYKAYDDARRIVEDELTKIQVALRENYATPYGALYAPSDTEALARVQQLAQKLTTTLKPTLFVLVGIGGSNKGTLAVLEALGSGEVGGAKGAYAPMKFMSVDTIDERLAKKQLAEFTTAVDEGHIPLLCIVTKSGTTAETIINSSLFLEVLKKCMPDTYAQHVVAITDTDSALYECAQKEGFELLEIPRMVGGRYSVFTPVGLFPLMMLGVDIEGFCLGAQEQLRTCLTSAVAINDVALTALSFYTHYKEGYQVHNLFVFSPYLMQVGSWYKQLIGESLGKKEASKGEVVEVGLVPMVSLGTTDLHSVAQVYLAGPRMIMTTFLYFSDESDSVTVPKNVLSEIIAGMPGRSITEVKSAIIEGTIEAFKKEDRPSVVIDLQQTSRSVGSFFIMKMVETMLLGRLWDINPFDQPGVELYKEETRQILVGSREG